MVTGHVQKDEGGDGLSESPSKGQSTSEILAHTCLYKRASRPPVRFSREFKHSCPITPVTHPGVAAVLSRAPRAATSAPWAAAACGTRGALGVPRSRAAAHDPFPLPGFGSATAPGTVGEQGSATSRSPTTPVSFVPLSLGTLQAGICFVLYRRQLSLSSPPTRPCPGYTAGHV